MNKFINYKSPFDQSPEDVLNQMKDLLDASDNTYDRVFTYLDFKSALKVFNLWYTNKFEGNELSDEILRIEHWNGERGVRVELIK
jgi:hypothetical protein